MANRSITVDGVAMATSDSSGRFTVSRRGYTPPADCTVDVNDGSVTATSARLSGCTVTSSPPPPTSPVILPDVAQLGPGYVGADFNPGSQMTVNFAQGAVGPVRWEVVAGALPDGLAVVVPEPGGRPSPIEDDTYMQIEGTPTRVQTSSFTLRATDANGVTATRTYTITINAATALAITPQSWPPVTQGESANLWIDGSGGVLPYRWTVSAGALPPGMALIQDVPDSRLVRVGGTPTAAGTFSWTLRLTDAQPMFVERAFSVTVAPGAGTAPVLSSLTIDPSSVTGGASATGTLTLGAPAPAGGAYIPLLSSDVETTRPAASVTIPAGATSASFTVSTTAVTASRTTTISATYAGTTRTATITLHPLPGSPAPVTPTPETLTLVPDTVTGGSSSSGTLTLNGAAPSGGTVVTLTSNTPQLAAVPASVTVPAGSTGATFTISTTAVTSSITIGITASSGGAARVASLTLNPAATSTETVSISRAQYDSGKRQLRVEATTSGSGATLQVYVTSTNALIGTLSGGSGQFTVSTNPQSITVRSSLGGSATRSVTLR